ncbi:MAG: glycosyltransferase [Sphingobacteriales bacterium]|nr:glycosyltransferase [Sphingobacteriales bacterium]MBI3720841.1 glycosyltransferase [Sphingobacteriales bacterium]
MKKLSVCMLAHNTEKFIDKAVESVLAQKTNFEIELVIAEDKSTDNTKQKALYYKEKYPDLVKLILNQKNLGLSGNYIVALKNCSAEYVAILDSDDYWTDPYKLQKQVDFLEANKDYGVVYSDCDVIDHEGNAVDWQEMYHLREQYSSGYVFFKLLKETAFVPNLTGCFRKELIADALENEDLWFFEDWWLWMRASIKTKFHFMDERTAHYRLHPQNITKTRIENKEKLRAYTKKAYAIYNSNIEYFEKYNKNKLSAEEKELISRRMMMLLNRNYLPLKRKLKLLIIFIKYFPGIKSFTSLLTRKMKSGTPVAA